MKRNQKALYAVKSTPRSNGPTQTTATVTNAKDLTAKQAELLFQFSVHLFTGVLAHLSKCNDRERRQLARFIDACCDRLRKATSDFLVQSYMSRNFKNRLKRERAVQFATFEKMGRMIERQKRI